MTKFDTLIAKYQGNVYPAMLNDLASHLGVPATALYALEVGWAPCVPTTKGTYDSGCWVIPERDDAGQVVGFSLRSQADRKWTYPGSRRGLVYPLNPKHSAGQHSVARGVGGFVRTANAGVLCPICNKPDGCLVSSDNPENPDTVICIRVAEGSVKPMRLGYLHRRHTLEAQADSPVLAPSSDPVLIVEGASDVAAAMGLGFVAVGRPSNLSGLELVTNVVRGRSVIVVGENDNLNPATQQRPGHEGMIAAFQVLRRVCPSAQAILPPDHIKDLRHWIRAGLTHDAFLEEVKRRGKTYTENRVLPDAKPLTMARMWLDDNYRMAGRYTLRYYRGMWYRYGGTKYTEVVEDTDIRGPLYTWLDNKVVNYELASGSTGVKPVVCNRSMVTNIVDAMLSPCPLRTESIPAWINESVGPNPAKLIAFANGLVWVEKYLQGASESEYLLSHTPDFFTTVSLPFSFDPTARCPEWDHYLATTLGDEPAKIELLREWFGYCMTPDTSLHKLMLMRGPKRSGKSTAVAVLSALIGLDQVGSISFAQLTERFGLEGLVGKQLAVMGDARLPRNGDSTRALELLLNIVGEDAVSIDRKFRPPLVSHRLMCRFTMATNELPELPDHAGALEARLNILDFQNTFIGREDFGLRDRLIAEAPGIAIWALSGLQALRARGRFVVPASSRTALAEWRTTTSPTAAFLEECCNEGDHKTHEVSKQELYDAWSGWSRERGLRPLPKSRFYERIKASAPFAASDTYEQGGHKYSVYRGLTLKPWATRQYTNAPPEL